MSLDSLACSDFADDNSSLATIPDSPYHEIEGIQIVDPKNRYRHPKSKLHDSDMGPLAMALGQDASIQRLPEIKGALGNK